VKLAIFTEEASSDILLTSH